MKKFLKISLIIILIAASVGITAFLFYRNLNKDVDYFSNLIDFSSSKENEKFLKDLERVETYADRDRFALLYATNINLDSSLNALSTYLILEKEYDFKDKSLKNEYSNLKSAKNLAVRAMDEYFTKIHADGPTPPPTSDPSRADYIYTYFANYFVSYSKFLKKLDNELSSFNLNKSTDLKFTLINLYADVCITTFSNLNDADIMIEIKDKSNIEHINKFFKMNNSFVQTDNTLGDFSYLTRNFINAYNNCNKVSFASNLNELSNDVSDTLQEGYTNEQIAAYWFNKVFEV